MTSDTRQAQVRSPLRAAKPVTKAGQWHWFGPDRAFAYDIETGRVTPLESTPAGWNLTLEIQAPNDANGKLAEHMEIKASEINVDQKLAELPPGDLALPAKVVQLINGSVETLDTLETCW